jgi:hypothetical protein
MRRELAENRARMSTRQIYLNTPLRQELRDDLRHVVEICELYRLLAERGLHGVSVRCRRVPTVHRALVRVGQVHLMCTTTHNSQPELITRST